MIQDGLITEFVSGSFVTPGDNVCYNKDGKVEVWDDYVIPRSIIGYALESASPGDWVLISCRRNIHVDLQDTKMQ